VKALKALAVVVPRDLAFALGDTPTAISELARRATDAGVDIRGVNAIAGGSAPRLHLLVDDTCTPEMLSAARLMPEEVHDVVVLDLVDTPGVLATISGIVGRAGISIELAYTSGPWLVLLTDNPAATRAVLANAAEAAAVIRAVDPPLDDRIRT
jgi:hypothetical protein